MSFGSGLGQLVGAHLAENDLNEGGDKVNDIAGGFISTSDPYNSFGKSFLDPAKGAIGGVSDFAKDTEGYNQFMSTYTNTPAAQYQLQQADAAQNNSAAARGSLLSGANERALKTIDNGIISQNANSAYNEYLAGNNQQFGQLEGALGNMFKAIGVGTTVTGQQASVNAANMASQSAIAQAQAKNDQQKGSGMGSMFDGIGSAAFAF